MSLRFNSNILGENLRKSLNVWHLVSADDYYEMLKFKNV